MWSPTTLAKTYLNKYNQGGRLDYNEWWWLQELNNGNLYKKYNEATKKYGHGRLLYPDGTHVDIGGSTGGVTRRALDNYVVKDFRLIDFK